MLSRIIRGNAALYAQFGFWWIGCVAIVCTVGFVAVVAWNPGLMIVAALAAVGLLIHCVDSVDEVESQASREARFLAQHQDVALNEARRRFLAEPTIHLVMPNLGDGQEL